MADGAAEVGDGVGVAEVGDGEAGDGVAEPGDVDGVASLGDGAAEVEGVVRTVSRTAGRWPILSTTPCATTALTCENLPFFSEIPRSNIPR